jgi:hypothetical protein
MSSGGPNEPSNLLDLYLDGLLPTADRERFELRLQQEPTLRAELELHQQLTKSLNSLFAPPAAAQFSSFASATSPPLSNTQSIRIADARIFQLRASRPRFIRPLRAAAIAAIFVFSLACWQVYRVVFQPPRIDSEYKNLRVWRSMDVVYQAASRKGGQPDWKCEDDREFAMTYFKELGQGMLMKPLPSNLLAMGVSYTNTLSPRTLYFMARQPGEHGQVILVFADRIEKDSAQKLTDPTLRLFRKQVGSLVLYEVTPFDSPKLIDLFYESTIPNEWRK